MIKLVILAGVVVILIILIISYMITRRLIHPKIRDEQKIYEREMYLKRFPVTFYQSVMKDNRMLQSRFGYQLSCQILENEVTKRIENHNKIAVFCHGYKCSKTSTIVYAKMLMDLGYTAVLYDHRNHGKSDKNFTSMGFYEKEDLDTIIQYCYQRFGPDISLVVHGESMGAATVLSYLTTKPKLAAVIADCGYSDLTELVKHQVFMRLKFPAFLFLPFVNLMLRWFAGFSLKEVSPIQGVLESNLPILFIHGDQDRYVPYQMSIKMYETCKGDKELYLAKGAIHAQACVVDPELYNKKIKEFLDKYELV